MRTVALLLLLTCLCGCSRREESEARKEASLYNDHDGLTLPEDMQRELGLQLATVNESMIIPEGAIIRGAKEDFVYVQDGQHFVRSRVELGTPTNAWVAVTKGLSAGDRIVTHAVKDLWMIELLAIRGGEPCCPSDGKL